MTTALTNEEINVKLAKALGWTEIVSPNHPQFHRLLAPNGEIQGSSSPDGMLRLWLFCIPNYTGSYDAVAEAELSLTGHGMPPTDQADTYVNHLINVCLTVEPRCLPCFATPKQRALALLATLTTTNP